MISTSERRAGLASLAKLHRAAVYVDGPDGARLLIRGGIRRYGSANAMIFPNAGAATVPP